MKDTTNGLQKVIIVGSGPAGLTAAIYAARANLRPLVLEGNEPGGQLTTTTDVENYPGFPEGIQGPELMVMLRKQAERFGAVCVKESAASVDLSQRPFAVRYADQDVRAHALIAATGASARYIGLPSEQALRNKGVSACATCDGFFFRGKRVAVVGGGDTAMEEATFLTRFCTRVFVVHRRDKLRASRVMQERALANPKIELVWNSVVTEVLDVQKGEVTGLRLRNLQTGEDSLLEVGGLFVAIGHEPNTALFKGQLEMNEVGYLLASDRTHTNVEGVFACGDCADFRYRQAITAAGTGCQAAMEAAWYLEEHGL
ncbi:MAG: thioredoxin-disulfide reductase [Candidatus Riflebacteria bacterium]|nr:thioredoxin-disulfide reductase [Candidatus Riflebacteria bacterium]